MEKYVGLDVSMEEISVCVMTLLVSPLMVGVARWWPVSIMGIASSGCPE